MMWRGRAAVALLSGSAVLAGLGLPSSKRAEEAPSQPIAFSHRIHAGDNQIACAYCHTGVARTAFAGVPPVATCYECHRAVQRKSPEIQKVFQHWEAKEPIRWVRVHQLPDYVYFSHKRHVTAGVACASCHGEIDKMDRVGRQAPLTMGWCLQCHQQRGAPRECDTCHK
jgi:hypothetical protein